MIAVSTAHVDTDRYPMPHLTIEYTDNVQGVGTVAALRALNEALVASGQFGESDIKSRAIPIGTFAVGTQIADRGFVHARLAILDGRSPEIKKALSQALLEVLRDICLPDCPHVQLCAEVSDIDRASYSKVTYEPNPLSP
ncbi:5-carboxymethyl-2-hydroxymuconate Delta-isomerase [Marilutibacter maris]|uniref:5-carboxymethyl-2-hydroxymuconate isomerase n=1 Tax=Marilutibacter maris TaxID=1605891 RepID=A0A2U9T5F8_9GAMM|nr:5-carboxymethyl-2-hydroxymuconate Delta-isomerase [Lysobacter maris]AWV07761.1 5-carboxymethyl-2-hydroxymuconate isomerase [Lysobacter maris]